MIVKDNTIIDEYFLPYMNKVIKNKISVKYALKLLESYFEKAKVYSLNDLKELKLKGFQVYLKKKKNKYGKRYNKNTIKEYLYILRKWFLWAIEDKGLKYLYGCLIELENIIDSYKSDRRKIEVEITEEQGKLMNDFIEHERLRGSRTYKEIKCRMKIFFKYITEHDIDFVRLTLREAENFQVYLASLTDMDGSIIYNPKTIEKRIIVAKSFYSYLKKKKLVYSNPFDLVKHIKSRKKLPRDLPDEEKLLKLLDYFKEFWKQKGLNVQKRFYKLHVLSELMYSSGLRLGEVTNLEEKDIDFDRKVIRVSEGKGGRQRIAYLNEYAGNVLEVYIKEMSQTVNYKSRRKKVFGANTKSVLNWFINTNLKRYTPCFKIKRFTSHSFRHCLGYHLLRRGCGIRYIQLILGHEQLRTTEIYTKVDKESLKNQLDIYHPRRLVNMRGLN